MNILLCLKPVSHLSFTDVFSADEPAGRASGGQTELNPADAYALELALRMKDQNAAHRITVMSMAPPAAEPLLRQALAAGADEAVLVSDPLFAGADTLATSRILAGAVHTLPAQDLILCGKKAIDAETGHIGPQLACLLGLECWSNVLRFSGEALIRAESDGEHRYPLPVPALLTVINGTTPLRAPTIAALRAVRARGIRRMDSRTIPPAYSGTETLSVTEQVFAHRRGLRECDLERGLSCLYERIMACK